MKKYSYYKFFMNFSNRTKSDIINLLREGPLNVKEIARNTGGGQSRVSHSLRDLRKCHILNVKQKGKERIYSLNEETVVPILELVERHVRKNCLRGCEK
jgi:DNA-binding transcriptional ArsR family regulator